MIALCALLLSGCGSEDDNSGGAAGSGGVSAGSGGTSSGGGGTSSGGTSSGGTSSGGTSSGGTSSGGTSGAGGGGTGGGGPGGKVDFVPIYETGSAWNNNTTAKNMVDTVFADFEANLSTSGNWDATIEVYLTDDSSGFAHTTFDKTFHDATVNGQQVKVVGAWLKIVQGGADPNGPAQANGDGAEFSVHFNVAAQADNRGLLRHEMMHGLGAVGAIPWFTMSPSNVLDGVKPGERHKIALYDTRLVDLAGKTLFSNYNAADSTFEMQNYSIETTLADWMDGDGGVFFQAVTANNTTTDMPLLTGPGSGGGGELRLNEMIPVMSASAHPTWNTIEAPDRSFLRAMGYNVPNK